MIHAAALFLGVWALWLVLTQRWDGVEALGVGAGVALVCVLIAARFGALGRSAFSHAPHALAFVVGGAGGVLRGALATVRAAIAADVRLRPALVRIRTRPSSAAAQAQFADLISAAPGAVVVEADAEGLLVHVLDEDSVDASGLGVLEARVIRAVDGKSAA